MILHADYVQASGRKQIGKTFLGLDEERKDDVEVGNSIIYNVWVPTTEDCGKFGLIFMSSKTQEKLSNENVIVTHRGGEEKKIGQVAVTANYNAHLHLHSDVTYEEYSVPLGQALLFPTFSQAKGYTDQQILNPHAAVAFGDKSNVKEMGEARRTLAFRFTSFRNKPRVSYQVSTASPDEALFCYPLRVACDGFPVCSIDHAQKLSTYCRKLRSGQLQLSGEIASNVNCLAMALEPGDIVLHVHLEKLGAQRLALSHFVGWVGDRARGTLKVRSERASLANDVGAFVRAGIFEEPLLVKMINEHREEETKINIANIVVSQRPRYEVYRKESDTWLQAREDSRENNNVRLTFQEYDGCTIVTSRRTMSWTSDELRIQVGDIEFPTQEAKRRRL